MVLARFQLLYTMSIRVGGDESNQIAWVPTNEIQMLFLWGLMRKLEGKLFSRLSAMVNRLVDFDDTQSSPRVVHHRSCCSLHAHYSTLNVEIPSLAV